MIVSRRVDGKQKNESRCTESAAREAAVSCGGDCRADTTIVVRLLTFGFASIGLPESAALEPRSSELPAEAAAILGLSAPRTPSHPHPRGPEVRGSGAATYPLVDPAIAAALACDPDATAEESAVSLRRYQICPDTGRLQYSYDACNGDTDDGEGLVSSVEDPLPLSELVRLALDCDRATQDDGGASCIGSPLAPSLSERTLQSLPRPHNDDDDEHRFTSTCWDPSPLHTAASLVLLNEIEAALCRRVAVAAGGVPDASREAPHSTVGDASAAATSPQLALVLRRYEALETAARNGSGRHSPHAPLTPLLKSLLLPSGLNLRNLLWHGFVGKLHRPWVSLLQCVLRELEGQLWRQEESGSGDEPLSRPPTSDPVLFSPPAAAPNPPLEWFKLPSTRGAFRSVMEPGHAIRCSGCRGSTGADDCSAWGPALKGLVDWLPTPQHAALLLWAVGLARVGAAPHLVCAVLVVLLEGGLRRDFAQFNHGHEPGWETSETLMARPGVRYVTLDGHSQRHQHHLLLQPYFCNSKLPANSARSPSAAAHRNRLIVALGGSRTALLTDLFLSPHGPNLRASMAHGAWNTSLRTDWRGAATGAPSMRPSDATGTSEAAVQTKLALVWDCVDLLLGTLHLVAHKDVMLHYRPQFSFTATTRDDLERLNGALLRLETRTRELDSAGLTTALQLSPNTTERLKVSSSLSSRVRMLIVHLHHSEDGSLQSTSLCENGSWTTDQLYQEYRTNQAVGPEVATRGLLRDLQVAVNAFVQALEAAQLELALPASDGSTLERRQRKKNSRVVACSATALHFYSFAAAVAIDSLEWALHQNEDCEVSLTPSNGLERNKLVERTRMVVSTVCTFLTVNAERAVKAIEDYSKSKLLKSIQRLDAKPSS